MENQLSFNIEQFRSSSVEEINSKIKEKVTLSSQLIGPVYQTILMDQVAQLVDLRDAKAASHF
jgi:hypothetical protein